MTRHDRAGIALASLLCVHAGGVATAAIIAPPAANLGGAGPYHQYTNGIFAQNAVGATESTFPGPLALRDDTWTLNYTNTQARMVWTGFKLGIEADGGGFAQINTRFDGAARRGEPNRSDTRATAGFGAAGGAPINFTNDAARFAKNAELSPKNAKGVVAPAQAATFVVPISGRSGEVYHLKAEPISAAPVAPAMPAPGGGGGGGGGMSFNPGTGGLGLNGFTIGNLAGDDLDGASVSVPTYSYSGPLADGNHVFQGSGPLVISTGAGSALTADAPLMYFDTAQNLFFAKLHDPTQVGVTLSSPYLSSMMSQLDPDSPAFNPDADMWIAFRPSARVGDGTLEFTSSLVSSGEASIFVVPVPGATAFLGISGVLLASRRRRE